LKNYFSLLILLLPILGYSQSTINEIGTSTSKTTGSNYSFFGLGEELYNGPAEHTSKGGLGVAYINYLTPNFLNPASLYQNKLTSFQVGVKLSELNQTTNTTNNWSNNGALNYASIAFPINKWWGTGVVLNPAFSKGYDFNKTVSTNTFGKATYYYRGNSTINRVNWSNGINPFKWFKDSLATDFSIGFGVSYYFGTGTSYKLTEFENNVNLGLYNIISSDENIYDGFQYNVGIMHRFYVRDSAFAFSLGATYDFSNKIYSNNTVESYNYIKNKPPVDSVDYYTQRKEIQLPSSFKIGTTITYKEKLNIGLEYRRTMYSQFSINNQKENMRDVNTYIVGAEYNPTEPNKGRLMNTNYRVGLRYSEKPYIVNNTKINEYACSIGIGLPVKRAFTTANIGLEYVHRGSTINGLILEKYFNAYVGLTINDKWFKKQKYD
jgi:hypothetical protein